jgi:hypothetical protein
MAINQFDLSWKLSFFKYRFPLPNIIFY